MKTTSPTASADAGRVGQRSIELLGEGTRDPGGRSPGADPFAKINTMNNLALGYRFAGQIGRALPLSEQVLSISRLRLGARTTRERPSNGWATLAAVYELSGRLADAVPLYEGDQHSHEGEARPGPSRHPDQPLNDAYRLRVRKRYLLGTFAGPRTR